MRRFRSRAPLSFATNMAFSNSEMAPRTCRIRRAVGVSSRNEVGKGTRWLSCARERLILCSRPNVVEHCKGHVAYVTFSAFHHFHVDAKRVRKLSRQNRVVLFKAVDKNLECRDHFNTDQCEELPDEIATTAPQPPPSLIEPTVEALIKASGIPFRIGGDRAFYAPAEDYVQVPPPQAYFEPINWHRTALHELGHATGHRSRLNRDQDGSYGTKKYAFEELVAELSAAFGCASLGIVPTVRHADYIGSWLEILREDNRAIVRAASQASKAADYLLGFVPGSIESASPELVVGNSEAA